MSKSLLAALLILTCALATLTLGQQANSSPTSPPAYGEKELKDAQINRENAQADYYREEINRLRRPAEEKTFWQSVSENPASALGVIGAFLTALFAAMVGLLNLFVNNRTALRAQRDTQFYEALKRFGDKDSAAVRSSAAGMLAQMGIYWTTEFNFKYPLSSLRNEVYPYFNTAWNQLITGALLEEDIVVLIRITEAMEQIIEGHPTIPFELLRNANVKLQEDVRIALINLFIALGAEKPEDITDELWVRVSPLIQYWPTVTLKYFTKSREDRFKSLFRSHLLDYTAISDSDKPTRLRTVSKRVQLSGFRLFQNISTLSFTLQHHQIRLEQIHKNPLFLPGAKLSEAHLQAANLKKVILTTSDLRKANLQGANLSGAILTDAKLHGIYIDELTDFSQTKWWEAEFSQGEDVQEVDTKLLGELYSRYANGIPADLNKVHSSARTFISEKHKTPAAVTTT